MYRPPAFAEDDPATLTAMLARVRLATLVSMIDGELVADLVPMLHDPAAGPLGTLTCHLARANPQAAAAQDGRAVLIVVPGADAYVSPSFYPSKAETGRVVPTWNYEVIQVHGCIRRFEDPEALLALVGALTDRHEAGRPNPWSVGDAPEDFVRAQLKGIVGLAVEIERIEGKRKLSQNRSAGDRAGVIAGLAASQAPGDRELSAAMTIDPAAREP